MAADDLPDELTIELRKPIEFGEQTWTQLGLKEPTPRQFIAVDALRGTERAIQLIFENSGMPIGAIRDIGARDLARARDYLKAFAEDAPPATIDEALTIELRRPVVWNDVEYRDLALREPTAGELARIDRYSGLKVSTHLIALVSGTPVEAVERLAMRDFKRGEGYLLGFILAAPPTGAAA